MRLFTAIELDGAVREHLGRVTERLGAVGRQVRWTRGENLHVTLKFIGEVADAGPLRAALGQVRAPAMRLRCEGLVFFPPRGGARIVAAQVGGDVGLLGEVLAAVEEVCAGFGVTREGRAYRPHVTLGRSRQGVRAQQQQAMVEAAEPLWPGPTMRTAGVALVQSVLTREGARYEVVERWGNAE